MTAGERRYAILETLCRKRYDTIKNLAIMFGVSRSTVRRDIIFLSCSYPLQTKRGHYGGGVYVEEWFYLDRRFLSPKQIALLKRILPTLDEEDQKILKSILAQFVLCFE